MGQGKQRVWVTEKRFVLCIFILKSLSDYRAIVYAKGLDYCVNSNSYLSYKLLK